MNETELEKKLSDLGIKFTASTFKPNAQEISVYEQLLSIIEQPKEGPLPGGVLLKPVHPDFLQPLRQM